MKPGDDRLVTAYRAVQPNAKKTRELVAWIRSGPAAMSLGLDIHRRRRAAKLSATWTETPESEAEGELIRAMLSEPIARDPD